MTVRQPYPVEVLDEDQDCGTMPESAATLTEAVVGRRIASAELVQNLRCRPWSWSRAGDGLLLTLDDGTRVEVANTEDCCAYTQVEEFLLHPERVDHVITGVGTTGEFTRWHIFADFGDVLELTVGWSCGNPFYYGYGFDITVIPAPEGSAVSS